MVCRATRSNVNSAVGPELVRTKTSLDQIVMVSSARRTLALSSSQVRGTIERGQIQLMVVSPMRTFVKTSISVGQTGRIHPIFQGLKVVTRGAKYTVILVKRLGGSSKARDACQKLNSVSVVTTIQDLVFVKGMEGSPAAEILVRRGDSLTPPKRAVTFGLKSRRKFQ